MTQIDFEKLSLKFTLIRSFTILVSTGSICGTLGWSANKVFTWKQSMETRVAVLEVRCERSKGFIDSITSFKMRQQDRDLQQDYRIDKIKRK